MAENQNNANNYSASNIQVLEGLEAVRIRPAMHRCKRCGALSSNRTAADDNPMKLMSIALRPLCEPPFPLERIREMTALMGGDGSLD